MSQRDKITDKQREIVFNLIEDGQSVSHIASYVGLTKANVRRLKKDLQRKLSESDTSSDSQKSSESVSLDTERELLEERMNKSDKITARDVIDFDDMRSNNVRSIYYRKHNVQWLARSAKELFPHVTNHRRNTSWSQGAIREVAELLCAEFTNMDVARIMPDVLTRQQVANLKNTCYEYARTHGMQLPTDHRIGNTRRIYNTDESVLDHYVQKLVEDDTRYELVKNKQHDTTWTREQADELLELVVNEKLTLAEIARFNNDLTTQDIAIACNEFDHVRDVICKNSTGDENTVQVDNSSANIDVERDDEQSNNGVVAPETGSAEPQTNDTLLLETKPLRREWNTPDIAAVTLLKDELSVSAMAQALNRYEDDIEAMLANL